MARLEGPPARSGEGELIFCARGTSITSRRSRCCQMDAARYRRPTTEPYACGTSDRRRTTPLREAPATSPRSRRCRTAAARCRRPTTNATPVGHRDRRRAASPPRAYTAGSARSQCCRMDAARYRRPSTERCVYGTSRPVPSCAASRGIRAMILSVAVLPDGRRALSVSDDRTLRVWDIETGAELRRFEWCIDDGSPRSRCCRTDAARCRYPTIKRCICGTSRPAPDYAASRGTRARSHRSRCCRIAAARCRHPTIERCVCGTSRPAPNCAASRGIRSGHVGRGAAGSPPRAVGVRRYNAASVGHRDRRRTRPLRRRHRIHRTCPDTQRRPRADRQHARPGRSFPASSLTLSRAAPMLTFKSAVLRNS